MFGLLITIALVAAVDMEEWDPIKNQLKDFMASTDGPIGTLTTSGGTPVSDHEATSTLDTDSVIDNEYFLDKITHFVEEKIPERIVHPKGSGAFGYFEVTHDISDICKANFLSKVGKKTPIAARLSTTRGNRGGSDVNRDTRGMSIKFYTEEGNLDLTGFSTSVFTIKDAVHFDSANHAAGINPATGFTDISTFWDFLSSLPESIFLVLQLFSDLGIPAGYAHMAAHPIHTYQVVNDCGVYHFVRFHFIPDAGIKHLTSAEAKNISSNDPDFMGRDLFTRIAKGQYPTWTVSVQILSEADLKKTGHIVFDVTTLISTRDFPLLPVGKIVLNENPNNYHAQVEQMAFCPSSLVPGILGAPDKLFLARRLAYRHSQMYRLGSNFKKIPVNCPFRVDTHTYVRDGVPPVGDNEKGAPNYYPNSFNGAEPYREKYNSKLIKIKETSRVNNLGQAAEYYEELSSGEKSRLIDNFSDGLKGALPMIQIKVLNLIKRIHRKLGEQLAKKLKM
ncbi:catalase-like [Bicyclus anynana]|uniref:Catalase-like n=1 Tax=Bicyclus anynana TaxID=110368 RepID=A0A6J1MR33_BICAN|nr:catalase-like [Bicyclus anynana]